MTLQLVAPAPAALRPSHREVLQMYRRYGPLDDAALLVCARNAGLTQSPSGLRSRRAELVRMGAVVDSGQRLPSLGGRSRRCVVWTLAGEVRDD